MAASDQHIGFVFNPHDWLMDEKLRLCSFTTKGVWIELICWMHKSKRRGFLVVNGKTLDKEGIFKLLKCTEQEFAIAWKELIMNGVISQHDDGTYYSKRVVNDVAKSDPMYGLTKEEVETIDRVIMEFNKMMSNKVSYDIRQAKSLIAMRMRFDGAKFHDFVTVMHGKNKEWKDSDAMRIQIRPRVIFGDKFYGYLQELAPQSESAADPAKVIPRFDYDNM